SPSPRSLFGRMAGAFRWEANAPVAELEPGRSLPLRIRRVGPRSYSRRRRTPRGRRRLRGPAHRLVRLDRHEGLELGRQRPRRLGDHAPRPGRERDLRARSGDALTPAWTPGSPVRHALAATPEDLGVDLRGPGRVLTEAERVHHLVDDEGLDASRICLVGPPELRGADEHFVAPHGREG